MPTITVKNIPHDLYASLKRSSQVNRRSLIRDHCLHRACPLHPSIEPEEVLGGARLLREKKDGRYVIGDEEFTAAKVAGRP